MVYIAYFHSVLKYGLIFWGKCTDIGHAFILLKRIVRTLAGVGYSSNTGLFKKFDILPALCQYILSLMVLLVDNLEYFQTNLSMHGVDRRNTALLCKPVTNPTCFQKGVFYAGKKSSIVLKKKRS